MSTMRGGSLPTATRADTISLTAKDNILFTKKTLKNNNNKQTKKFK